MIKLILTLLIIFEAKASYFEGCKVWADVRSRNDETHFVLNVRRVSMLDGSHGKAHCSALRSGPQLIILDEGKLREGASDIELEYTYSDGLGPDGVVFTKRWKLIKEN